jgi:hypothetical protein
MPSIADVIEISKVSVSLVIKAIDLGQENDINLPKKISMESSILQWVYSNAYSGIDINAFSEYVYGMCGGYAYEAEGMIGTGGIVIDPAHSGVTMPTPLGKFAGTGNTQITFSAAINKSLLSATRGAQGIGEIIFVGTPVDDQVRWDNTTGTLFVAADRAFTTGEFVRILVY